MGPEEDPFRHHPALRDLIADPTASRFRDINFAEVRENLRARDLSDAWILPDDIREAGRRACLSAHPEGEDLWVFGYGSLMWDPAILFTELRRARVPGHARRFILRDIHGGRGTPETPGLMVALDAVPGAVCDGLAFRIAAADIENETRQLWARERIGPAYLETFVTAETAHGPIRALTFVADHRAELIDAEIGFEDQVRCAATGTGTLGTSLDYLRNIARHFAALRIPDAETECLLEAAERYAAG
ncbi:gamma-glutamylcyclotransferase [Rhodobacterales bacterium HKCCE3408]|nr:gamma-glutamylcyclotransferase [Rhodobacterales bacterium HKCCE3408]